MEPRTRISRRQALAAAAGAVGLGAFAEVESLQGKFDHRASPGASGTERYAASLRALDAAPGASAVVHVGHSTHLLAVGGLRLLTDPWFYDPAFGALAHELPPAVLPTGLGPLDVILITHDHADHADARALDQIPPFARRGRFLRPPGGGRPGLDHRPGALPVRGGDGPRRFPGVWCEVPLPGERVAV